MTPPVPARVLSLEGSFNFRDLGGYHTVDGSVVRWRRLFRADGPHALTEADVDGLSELGILTVIDLRTAGEVERGRWTDHLGPVTEHHLPLVDVLPQEPEVAHWTDAAHVARHYRHLLENAAPSIANALRILAASTASPAMFHCSAGKDRTGVLAAVVLGLLGVADDDIIADYALSGVAMERYFQWLMARADDKERLEKFAPAVMAAAPESMAAVVHEVRAEHGSFGGYVEAIGAGDAIPELRARLLTSRD